MDLYDVLLMRKFGGGGGKPSPSPTPSGGEPKNVNFYDYEGTLLKSYTTDEWASVTELPENPTHEGLTAQGWNWTLEEINQQLVDVGGVVNVGQMYVTDDGKTRIYIELLEGRTSPYLGLQLNGTVEIDWGDGSATDTMTGTSNNIVFKQHIYQSDGDYIIKLNAVDDKPFTISGNNSGSYLLNNDTNVTSKRKNYLGTIKKIEIGNNCNLSSYGFMDCFGLKYITIPNELVTGWQSLFQGNRSFKFIVIPRNSSSVGTAIFKDCDSLKTVSLPPTTTRITSNSFGADYALESITIPYGVVRIDENAFQYCENLENINIPDTVATWNSYVFSYCFALKTVSNVKLFGYQQFMQCMMLKSIIIPDNVSSIRNSCFSGCYSLASLTIPSGVTNIESTAFGACYGMKEYHFLSTTPPSLANTYVFSDIPSDCIIYVPMESVDAYKTATNWSNYASQIQGE